MTRELKKVTGGIFEATEINNEVFCGVLVRGPSVSGLLSYLSGAVSAENVIKDVQEYKTVSILTYSSLVDIFTHVTVMNEAIANIRNLVDKSMKVDEAKPTTLETLERRVSEMEKMFTVRNPIGTVADSEVLYNSAVYNVNTAPDKTASVETSFTTQPPETDTRTRALAPPPHVLPYMSPFMK